MKSPLNFEDKIREGYSWLSEIADKLNAPDRQDWAYGALKGVLHTIRDRLELHEISWLSERLPLFVRGLFFEGYDPQHVPVMIYNSEFLNRFRRRMGPRNSAYFEDYLYRNGLKKAAHDNSDFLDALRMNLVEYEDLEPEEAFRAVIEVLFDHAKPVEVSELQQLMRLEAAWQE